MRNEEEASNASLLPLLALSYFLSYSVAFSVERNRSAERCGGSPLFTSWDFLRLIYIKRKPISGRTRFYLSLGNLLFDSLLRAREPYHTFTELATPLSLEFESRVLLEGRISEFDPAPKPLLLPTLIWTLF